MREPQPSQKHKATTRQGQQKKADAPGGAPIVPSIESHQQHHSTIDTIPHIATPDASDVRKQQNALPQPELDTPQSPTCTKRNYPSIPHKGITRHIKLQKQLTTSAKQKSTSPLGHSSERQHHARQPPAPLGESVPMSRKRRHPPGGLMMIPHPHTIARMSELLDTCTDKQYIEIIRNLPAGWSATNERSMTVTKRQLEMAQ